MKRFKEALPYIVGGLGMITALYYMAKYFFE